MQFSVLSGNSQKVPLYLGHLYAKLQKNSKKLISLFELFSKHNRKLYGLYNVKVAKDFGDDNLKSLYFDMGGLIPKMVKCID